jgi:hypothetical protein
MSAQTDFAAWFGVPGQENEFGNEFFKGCVFNEIET